MLKGLDRLFSTKREDLKSFSTMKIPSELIGKTYGEAQKVLRGQYGNRLATKEDLKYIQKNPDRYSQLQKSSVFLIAFGSKVHLVGSTCMPCLDWSGHKPHFVNIESWFEHRTDSNDGVVLRD